MGKASRRKRQQLERSAYARVMREVRWVLSDPEGRIHGAGEIGEWMLQGYKIALQRWLPNARVVTVDPAAIAGLPSLEDLKNAAAITRAPFPYTFLDFKFRPLDDGRKLAAALVLEDEAFGGKRCAFCWVTRPPGHDDWTVLWIDPELLARGDTKTTLLPNGEVMPGHQDIEWAIYGTLLVLESANVDLVQTAGPPRGHQAHGVPHFEVVIRQNSKRYVSGRPPQAQDWSHRWEVRGHFKHFRRGATYDANPDRRVLMPDGTDCVRIWCPPYVKGPQDKPLIPKRRVIA